MFEMSAIVSIAAEKMGGKFFQPMGSHKGRVTKGGSPGALGKHNCPT